MLHHQALSLDTAILPSRQHQYENHNQCEPLNTGLHHLGDLYLVRSEPTRSYPRCYSGFFSSDIDFTSGCGDMEVIRFNSDWSSH